MQKSLQMFKRIIDWLLPVHCVVCYQVNCHYFCAACLAELPWVTQSCTRCARALPAIQEIMICGECLIDPPPFERNITLFRYEFPVVSLITQLKFRKQLLIGKAFGSLLANSISMHYCTDELPQCVIPVPLHSKRLQQRGYNQALEIGRPIKKLGIPLDFLSVKRTVMTAPQTLIERKDRKRNVANAFDVVDKFNYEHVALLDDVVTTGSTVEEIARVLRKYGVRRIDLWCIARAGGER